MSFLQSYQPIINGNCHPTRQSDRAIEYLMQGYSCSAAVVMAYSEASGLSLDLAVKLAAGLAGGMAQGKTCGAVTGAILVAGLKYGPGKTQNPYAKDLCVQMTQEFCHRFKTRQKTIECSEILMMNHINPRNAESMKRLRETGLCKEIVLDAVQILEQLFREEPA